MSRFFKAFQLGTQRSGLFGINIAVSNTIAAISAATGQDLGSVHENSWAVFEFSAENEIKVVETETGKKTRLTGNGYVVFMFLGHDCITNLDLYLTIVVKIIDH